MVNILKACYYNDNNSTIISTMLSILFVSILFVWAWISIYHRDRRGWLNRAPVLVDVSLNLLFGMAVALAMIYELAHIFV